MNEYNRVAFRKWFKENGVNTYEFACWIQANSSHMPLKDRTWRKLCTPENMAKYLEQRGKS